MYPHPELNSYLQGCSPHVSKNILNRVIDKALFTKTSSTKPKHILTRLSSTQPQCYGPRVDVTRAKCAFGPYALPKLKRELHSPDPLIVRQAVTTLRDLLVNPEKLIEAIHLNIPDRLTDLLVSNDPYLRERVAMIYLTIANQHAGRKEIIKNFTTLLNFSKGLNDYFAAVRLKIAHVLEVLAQEINAANLLITCGFMESISAKLCHEKKDILLVHLDTLKWLLQRNIKAKAIEDGIFEKLIALLNKEEEELVLCKVLTCLAILCEDISGKQKANDMDLLKTLSKFLRDKRDSLKVEAMRVAHFVTITTPGKLRALELKMTNTLLYLATKKECCHDNSELLLTIIKNLTNIAETVDGRKILLKEYVELIEGIDVRESELLQKHKQILLDVIHWRP